LLPGGRGSGRLHVHIGQFQQSVREGSEMIIEVSTAGLFTPRVYKSRAGVVLTPDCVSPSALIRVRVNRPGGAELWTNPRPPIEPASSTIAPFGGGSPPDSSASTPGVGSKASGSEPPLGVHPKASSSGTPPGVSSKASSPQPPDLTTGDEEESWASNGWVPTDKWKWQWMLWEARGPDQKDDVWSPDWKLTPIRLEDLKKGPMRYANQAPPSIATTSDAHQPTG
jgi:hypothetical protein